MLLTLILLDKNKAKFYLQASKETVLGVYRYTRDKARKSHEVMV
jgi:hypothetical protein